MVNHAQDLMSVKKFLDLPDKLIPNTQLGNSVQSKSFEFSFLPNSSNGMSYLGLRIFSVGDQSSVSSCQDPGQWLHPLCIRHGRGWRLW